MRRRSPATSEALALLSRRAKSSRRASRLSFALTYRAEHADRGRRCFGMSAPEDVEQMLLALSAAAFGAAFGLRFAGFVVLPAIGSALVVAGVGWFSGDDTFGSLMSKLVLLLICLQLGYLGGAALRFSIASKHPLQVRWHRTYLDWPR